MRWSDSMANNNKFILHHKSIECDNRSIRAHFMRFTKSNLISQMSSIYYRCVSLSLPWMDKQNSNISNVLIVRRHEIAVEMDSIHNERKLNSCVIQLDRIFAEPNMNGIIYLTQKYQICFLSLVRSSLSSIWKVSWKTRKSLIIAICRCQQWKLLHFLEFFLLIRSFVVHYISSYAKNRNRLDTLSFVIA